MPNWKKVVTSGSAAELSTLSLTGLSAQNSETDVLTINTSNVLGTRQLGSNAFNSTTIPTDNDQLDNGAGYTTNTGTVTSISTGNANTLTKSGTTSVTLTPNVGSVTNGGGNLATGNDIYDHVTSRISGLTSNTGTVDTTGTVNANEFARFNDSNTLEALTVAETKTALSLNNVPNSDHTAQGYSTVTQLNASSSALQDGITTNASNIDGKQATLTFGISNTNAVKINSTSVADDEYARFTANGLESRSTSEVLSDIGGQAALTFGKSSGNALKSEEALTTNDILLMGSSNVKGRTYAELKSDLSLNNVPNSDHTAQGYSTVTQLNASSSALQTNINAKHDTIDSSNRLSATLIGANGNISNTEYGYLNGVTSAIQTQLDAKQATLTFGISNTNVLRANSNVADNDFLRVDGTSIEGRTAAELKSDLSLNNVPNSNHEDAGYATVTQLNASSSALVALDAVLQDGITTNESAISGKHPTINSGNRLNANLIGSNGNISNTEYGYLNGVSSNIQTQLNAKQASLTFGLANGNALRTEEALSQNDILLAGADEVKGRTYTELKSDLSLNNVENTAISTFAGSSNITTVGTIGTGTWQGTKIASAYLDDDTAHLSGTQTFSGAKTFSSNVTIDGTLTANNITFPQDTNITIETPDEDSGNGAGGNLTIGAGNGAGSNGNGGDITIQPGNGSGAGDGGNLTLTTGTGNPEGNIIMSSANFDIDATGNVTASGEISATGLFLPQLGTIEWLSSAGQTQTIKGTDNYIQIDGDNRVLVSADNDMTITSPLVAASGNISASGNFIGNRRFDSTSTVSNDTTHGDITYTGGQGTIAAGDIVYLDTSGNWQRAQANSTTKSIGLLGIALGEEASAQGILLRGMFTLDHNVGSNAGVPLYLDDTAAAQARTSAPATSGDIVRVIGYTVGTNYQIWFNPDGAFVEVA